VLAFPLLTEPGPALRAEVTLAEARPAPHREVQPAVRIHPPAAADGTDWMSVLAWQGGGSRLEHLRETAPGVWTTTAPLPVHGEWKTMVWLHSGR